MLESDDSAERARARVGTTLRGKWRLDALLGMGGMAAVYAATHRNGKRVAVKLLHPELSIDPKLRKRFQREGYAANAVAHPGAVTVDDDDIAEDGCAFLVMELVEGESLREHQARAGGRLPLPELLDLAEQLLATLAAAHDKGIVHRDIKPDNLFIDRNQRLRVGDFGLASVRSLPLGSVSIETGAILGTPAYMAPEQARGEWDEVDARTDVWAVGATLFKLLTGCEVHRAQTSNAVLGLAMHQPAQSIRELRSDLPRPIVELVDRALAFDASDRFSDAGEMLAALRAARSGKVATRSRSRRSALMIALAALLVAGIFVAAVLAYRRAAPIAAESATSAAAESGPRAARTTPSALLRAPREPPAASGSSRPSAPARAPRTHSSAASVSSSDDPFGSRL